MAKRSPLTEKLEEVKQNIARACDKAKRDPADVTIVAVTKTAAPEQIREVLSLGIADIGESRVQQLTQRAGQLNEFVARRQIHGDGGNMPEKIRWHMIGHLQRNKVKPLLPFVHLIHSIDSLRLAEELDAHAEKAGRKLPILMQVNGSEEPQKHGVAVGAAVHLAEQIDSMPGLQMVGLMTMAAHETDPAKARQAFSRTREIFDELKWNKIGGGNLRHLSMGMSDDYEMAVEEGATMVRLGSVLFGGGQPDHEGLEEG